MENTNIPRAEFLMRDTKRESNELKIQICGPNRHSSSDINSLQDC